MKRNYSIKKLNTFGMDVRTNAFIKIHDINELTPVLKDNALPVLILGEGSNILFTKDFEGLVIKNEIAGEEIVKEDDNKITIGIGSGESWHDLVIRTLKKGYYGLENLSLIPGTVGAAPIQNIGAYGVELKDVFSHLEAIDLETFKIRKFTKNDCKFGYRDSIFKNELKGKYFITKVFLNLSKTPDIKTEYGEIGAILKKKGINNPTPKNISKVIMKLRKKKLPNPQKLGNAGSFFKNPIISTRIFSKLKYSFPDMPFHDLGNENYKIPAAWLIENVNWKGKRYENAGSYKKQPLIIVNHGDATPKDILRVTDEIMESVYWKFGVVLEPEVVII